MSGPVNLFSSTAASAPLTGSTSASSSISISSSSSAFAGVGSVGSSLSSVASNSSTSSSTSSSSSSSSGSGFAGIGSVGSSLTSVAPDSSFTSSVSSSSWSSFYSAPRSESEYVRDPMGGFILRSIAEMPTMTLTLSEMIHTYGARIPLGVDLGKLEIKYKKTLTRDQIAFVVNEAVDLVRGAGVHKDKLNDLGVRFRAYCVSRTFGFPESA